MNRLRTALIAFFILLMVQPTWADICRQLTGTVIDVATRQPVSANLFVFVQSVRVPVGKSNASGTFTVAVPCDATKLLVSQPGYKEQSLELTNATPTAQGNTIFVTVPLVPNNRQSSVRPLRSEEMAQLVITTMTDKRQRTLFFLTDIYTSLPLQARTCFYYTKADWTNCLDPDVIGRFEMAYAELDILTVGIKADGYYAYSDSLVIYGDNRRTRQDYRLMRDLVTASVQVKGGYRGERFRCELRPTDGPGTILTPGSNEWSSTFEVMPQTYRLIVTDDRRQIRHQEVVSLKTGLNTVAVNLAPTTQTPPAAPAAEVVIPDLKPTEYIPPIYFLQSSYQLIPESEAVLRQLAKYMVVNKQYRLRIVGHTDNVGDEKKNLALSEYRGMVTINFLRQLGVSESRMTSTGKGSKEPLVPNDTEEHRIQNRRVALSLEK
ncbi:MAG: OmpA family protein [Cytophagales bacterium]|nr:MAG: OmpA family protein [Cytophagales bacterium]